MPGYNPDFLDGISLPLPGFTAERVGDVLNGTNLRDGLFADYPTYSIVMNKNESMRAPFFVALNIDQNQLKRTKRTNRWKIDSRVGAENQLDNDYYSNNPWDRGHLARRVNAAWGATGRDAQRASDETFYYTNACLQHANYNQDEWLALEDWVLNLSLDKDGKITTFTGPVYDDFVRSIRPQGRRLALIPSAFFKIVCFVNKQDTLEVRAFLMYQDTKALADKSGKRTFENQTYQVTIKEIEEKTGLAFADEIYEANPLIFSDPNNPDNPNLPERIEVDGPGEILAGDSPRPDVVDDQVDVFIAAAMVNAKGEERLGEWISILNLSADPVDLKDWKLSDLKRELILGTFLGDHTLLAPGQGVVIKPITPLILSNKGGSILLFNERDERVDRAKYSKSDASKENRPVPFLVKT